jgi:hypothetical protein
MAVGSLVVTVEGYDMPGRRCAPSDSDRSYDNVHAGIQRGREVIELVPGDAPDARWSFPINVKSSDDGSVDFGGPYVHGRRGDRFLYISWGAVDPDFEMFRRAKLHFADCDPGVLREALGDGELVCRVRMTDGHGNPRCAHVRAPDATWSVR